MKEKLIEAAKDLLNAKSEILSHLEFCRDGLSEDYKYLFNNLEHAIEGVLAKSSNNASALPIPDVSNRRELLLAYHEFYLKWRSTVSNSNPEYAVDAFLSKQ